MRKDFVKEKGQSLLEIALAIGLVVMVASALVVTTLNGLKNSQFSQNQARATKLAQEGIEQVKTAKLRNCTVIYSSNNYKWVNDGVSHTVWANLTSQLGTSQVNEKIFRIDLTSTPCQVRHDVNSSGERFDIFTRKITFRQDDLRGSDLRVKSEVSWTDISGTHKSELVTILANY